MSFRGDSDLEVKSSRNHKHKHLDKRSKERSDLESRGHRIDFKTFVREAKEQEMLDEDYLTDEELDILNDTDSLNRADWEEYVSRTRKE